VYKTVHSVTPPRCSYDLTEAGLALESVIESIRGWALTHLPETEDPAEIART